MLPEGFRIVSLAEIGCTEELEETSDTFQGNSLQKARYVFEQYNIPCFADDSGLEVAALNGAPGVYSARYAGPQRKDSDNVDLLLQNLSGKNDRKARFRTVIALIGIGTEPVFFEGRVDGVIINERRGANGFGYDPVFVPNGYNQTFAEMQLEEKNRISHRSKAIKQLVTHLKTLHNDNSANKQTLG